MGFQVDRISKLSSISSFLFENCYYLKIIIVIIIYSYLFAYFLQMTITERIFDFDDWNSYSIAEYYPYLTTDSFSSRTFVGPKYRRILDLSKPLGGQITGFLILYTLYLIFIRHLYSATRPDDKQIIRAKKQKTMHKKLLKFESA